MTIDELSSSDIAGIRVQSRGSVEGTAGQNKRREAAPFVLNPDPRSLIPGHTNLLLFTFYLLPFPRFPVTIHQLMTND